MLHGRGERPTGAPAPTSGASSARSWCVALEDNLRGRGGSSGPTRRAAGPVALRRSRRPDAPGPDAAGRRSLTSVSIGIDGSIDHRGASELAALAGVPHHQLPARPASSRTSSGTCARWCGSPTATTSIRASSCRRCRPTASSASTTSLRGHGGELLHMTKAYAFSLDERRCGRRDRRRARALAVRAPDGVHARRRAVDIFAIDVRGEAPRGARDGALERDRRRSCAGRSRLAAVPDRAPAPGDGALDAHVRLLRDVRHAVPRQRRRRHAARDAGRD